jgi:VIT1/CCC1 family predicted Fe2+/Mn2+ transporter
VQRTRVAAEDVYGGLAIVWLMVLATLPAIAPFLCFADRFVAARISNGLVLLTLFGVGYSLARSIHANPWTLGLSTVAFGLVMVVIVVLLGG